MFLKITSVFGGENALCATKRLLITVNTHVDFKVAQPIASVATLVATVGLLIVISLLGSF